MIKRLKGWNIVFPFLYLTFLTFIIVNLYNNRSCHQEYKTMLCTTDMHIIATKEDSIELNNIKELLYEKYPYYYEYDYY